MANQILPFGSIRNSKPDAVGVGAVERGRCCRKHHRVRQLLPWDVNPGMTIPRSCVKVKSTRAWELNTIDRPFGRGITEGSNMLDLPSQQYEQNEQKLAHDVIGNTTKAKFVPWWRCTVQRI